MNKKGLWESYPTWEKAEEQWDTQAKQVAQQKPIKGLSQLPIMPGITEETAKNLKWKSLKWMLTQDHSGLIRKNLLKHPFKYSWAFIKSIFKKKSYHREGDLFFYGFHQLEDFKKWLSDQNTIFVLGFSYCHKPFECPSGRFTPNCIYDATHPVCQQCFIGKAVNALPGQNTIPLFIPTIHYIGEKIFDIVHANPQKQVLFLITACEMTLEMFGDWGNMVNIKGIGVRLDGRICNTMKAFELSENGIKPGLTVVLSQTQKQIMDLIRLRRESSLKSQKN